MKQLYAVILTHGSAWQAGLPLEKQRDWGVHASFMDNLVEEGLVALGGPLGAEGALLIVRAQTPEEITSLFKADPWHRMDLLRIERIAPWTIRLGSMS